MKILVLSNVYPPDVIGGYEIGCEQAVAGLRDRGHEVRVLTSTPRRPLGFIPEPHVLRRLRLSDLWYNATRPRSVPAVDRVWDADSAWFSSHNVHTLIQELEEFQPDVVYVWMILGVGGLGLMGCLQHLKVPWVWHLMDEVPVQLCSRNWKLVPELGRAFDQFIAGRWLVCSQAMASRIEGRGVKLKGPVEVVPNWVVGETPPPPRPPRRPGPLRVVTAGRVTPEKGVDVLIEAAKLLAAEGREDFTIDVYGRVDDPAIPRLAHDPAIEGKVRFHGHLSQNDLMRRFDEADVFAFPTHHLEPFGFAPLEAAARGCAPLVSHVCGIAEWLVHGVHCLKAPRTPRGFADALAAMIDGRVDPAALGRRAQAVVWRDFRRGRILDAVERNLAEAAAADRSNAGTVDEAYRMILAAEKLTHAMVQEAFHD